MLVVVDTRARRRDREREDALMDLSRRQIEQQVEQRHAIEAMTANVEAMGQVTAAAADILRRRGGR